MPLPNHCIWRLYPSQIYRERYSLQIISVIKFDSTTSLTHTWGHRKIVFIILKKRYLLAPVYYCHCHCHCHGKLIFYFDMMKKYIRLHSLLKKGKEIRFHNISEIKHSLFHFLSTQSIITYEINYIHQL